MPIPNLLSKYGIKEEAKPTQKSGVPDLIGTKYNNFAEAPAPKVVPPVEKPGFFSDQRMGGIIKNTIKGLPKAALDVLGPGKILDYLKTPEGENAAFNLKPTDVAKEILPAAGRVIAQPAVDVAGIVTGPKTFNIPGLGPTPNIQQQAKEAAQAGESTASTLIKSTPQAIFDVLTLYGVGESVFGKRVSPITRPGEVKASSEAGVPETGGPKTGRLYQPIEQVRPVPTEAFDKIIKDNNIPVKTDYNPSNPVIFRITDTAGGVGKGQFFQIKPSFLDEFISKFKGNPNSVPKTELIPITQEITKANINPPKVQEQAPIIPSVPTPSAPTVQVPTVEKPTVQPQNETPSAVVKSNIQDAGLQKVIEEIKSRNGVNESILPTTKNEIAPSPEVEASLAGDLSNPDLPAKTPQELQKMIEQLNKVGQAYGILRKTGGVSSKAAGHFAPGGQKGVLEPKGKVELRNETVLNPRQYMSTLAHELGHAIDFAVNGDVKNSFNTFGKDLTPEQKAQLKQELMAITHDLVGKEAADNKPGYYYKPTELLARFLEKMVVSPGNIAEIAPLATDLFEKASIKNPIINEFLEAVKGAIDKGEVKHRAFFRDMRQTYQKQLGTRVGNIAWNHEVNFRAMKERAKLQIEKLIDSKFKGIKDDQELLFNALESITVTKDGVPQFGTRDFVNAIGEDEIAKVTANGYEPVLNENGNPVKDLVDGKALPRFAKARYTPEQGKAFFDQLTPKGKQLVKDFSADRAEAKDYFNRELIKDVHKIKGNVEGWVHHYWEDKGFSGGKNTLKMKQASATRKREGAVGYEKNLKEALKRSLTEINTADAYNKFIQEFFPTVTKPIAEGQEPDKGWVEVFGNIYKGGVGTKEATRTVVVKDGKSFVAKKPRYQMPKAIYERFESLRGLAEEANNAMRVINSVNRYWRVNILTHMGSNATNLISGGIQYSAKILKDFYSEALTGDITFPQTRSNIFATLTVLTPKGWQNAPDWIYGGDLSNSYGQFTGSGHPGIEKLDKAVDAYADKALRSYGIVERYWKKVITTAENVNGIKDLNMITKEGLKLPTKEEEELIAAINEQVDLFALDYDNVPVQLAQYKRGVLGQSLKPFAVFPYKITKLYTSLVEDAFDGTKPFNDRISSILAIGTLIGAFAWAVEERRKKQQTPAVGNNAPSSVDSAGKILVGTDAEGNEMFTRISKYPFLNIAEAGIQVSNGNIDGAWQVVKDMIGSVGPGGQIAAAVLGYKQDYQQYMSPSVIAGQALATFVPGIRILNDIAAYQDPYQRKPETFLQGFASFVPTSDPDLQEKLRGKIRTIQIPLEAGVRPAGDMPEGTRRTTTDAYVRNYKNDILWQALAGIYIKRIDPVEAEAFNVRAEKNAAAAAKKKSPALNPFYSQ